ncbi:hypothetical protein TNIN_280731 [Trichonephila inaurata madagascariensis]|uniref:Uncharacterized protein n=1 Tax=Trichonephila inaurata madagascariensis TaxID=2747483 RepID=A0A8X6Y8L2_9ARAC|nr:hypothetical protein TNIN_280731 [Trichonephila inaurata madagascariensis]
MKRLLIFLAKLRLLKNPHSFLHFWIRSLYGALKNRAYASWLNLNLKFCSSRWRIVLFIIGPVGLILVILAIIKMFKHSKTHSENCFNESLPQKMTEELPGKESSSKNCKNSRKSKTLFIKFTEVNGTNSELIRKIFNTQCSKCKNLERDATSKISELNEGFVSSNSKLRFQNLTNLSMKIQFPMESRRSKNILCFKNINKKGAGCQNDVRLVLSESDKLVKELINLEMKRKEQKISCKRKRILRNNQLKRKARALTGMNKISGVLLFNLQLLSLLLEMTLKSHWKIRVDSQSSAAAREAISIFKVTETVYVQETSSQTDL